MTIFVSKIILFANVLANFFLSYHYLFIGGNSVGFLFALFGIIGLGVYVAILDKEKENAQNRSEE